MNKECGVKDEDAAENGVRRDTPKGEIERVTQSLAYGRDICPSVPEAFAAIEFLLLQGEVSLSSWVFCLISCPPKKRPLLKSILPKSLSSIWKDLFRTIGVEVNIYHISLPKP